MIENDPYDEFILWLLVLYLVKGVGEEVVYRALDHITSGVEDIIGYHGRHWWIQKLREINAKYINPIFTRNAIKTYDEEIIRIFNRMAIKELIFH